MTSDTGLEEGGLCLDLIFCPSEVEVVAVVVVEVVGRLGLVRP